MANYVQSDHGLLQLNFSDIAGTIAATSAFAGTATNGFTLQIVSGVPTWAADSATNATNISNGYVLTMVSGAPAWAAASGGVTSITGTTSQVVASASTGAVTLSLPQSIATTSTPTFGGGTFNGQVGISSGTVEPLVLTTSSSGPWAISLTRSDLSTQSRVYNSTGTTWAYEHSPTVPGIVFNTGGAGTLTAAPTSYGSLLISGSTGGYSGIQFSATTNNRTFMVGNTNTIAGMYNQGTSAWDWYWTAGTLTTGTVPAANVSAGSFGSGAVTFSSTVTATGFTVSSDRELKTNIQPITNAADIVASLNGVRFNWKTDGTPNVGLIAQDVEVLLPELVHTHVDTGYKGVNYDGIIGVLVEEVKALRKELNALKGS
jgi:hypothetical protein